MNAIDLFAGMGGFSTGAKMAGCNVLWAANHWKAAVDMHAENHPDTEHACQDLHQANWMLVPKHDLLMASPCCQGHSRARGKSNGNPQHDASRSTAWAVVSALEAHRPAFGLVENVREFLHWALFPAWCAAVTALGYAISPHVVDAADFGVPQNRERMIIVLTRSKHPLELDLTKQSHVPASSFLDFDSGKWSKIDKPGRATATLSRVANGRKTHGDRFLIAYYGNEKGGRSIHRPVGTLTTRDRYALIDGDRMRIMSKEENRDGMSFPADCKLPKQHRLAVHMLGNAVPPKMAKAVISALRMAA